MKKYILFAAAAITLAACNNEDNYVDEPVAAHISATIGKSTVSRASETSWAVGDEIGVTMDDRYINMKYTAESTDGMFSGTTMYFKNKREPVTLTAYYPFKGEEGTTPEAIEANTAGINQTSEEQLTFDFLYAIKENVTGSEPDVELAFSHQMSKVTLTFKSGNDGTDLSKIVSYQIEGLVLEGTFDTLSGVCAVKSGSEAESLVMTFAEGTVSNGTPLSSLIIFPQAATHDTVSLRIVDSENQDYSCKLNFKDDALVSGNNYQWTITVNKTGLVIDKSGITDWNDESAETGAGSVLD